MKKSTINMVIIIGLLSIISIMIVQILWIKQINRAQKNAEILQQRQDSLDTRKFDKSVRIALRTAFEEIQMCDSAVNIDYGAVRQQSSNFFYVNLNEQLDPFYLEKLLERTFDANNVHQSFQFGIYDCFKDSVVHSGLIEYTKDSLFKSTKKNRLVTSPKVLKEKDNHYFTVFFPDVLNYLHSNVITENYPWIYLIIIVIVLLIFFTLSITVIIQQKRMSVVRADFVNNMTHELKTPISTIGLSSEILKKVDFEKDKERVKQYIDLIFNENKRLEQQVERVLNAARLDKDELDLDKEPYDIHQIIKEVGEKVCLNQGHTGVKIKYELNANSSVVQLDKVHFTNVFYNLLDNAIKYTRVSPQIQIETENKDNKIIIQIKDNGIGISKNDIKQIFDQFYRVNTGNRHDVKGFGLGLYYVQLIVQKHNGKISVHSKPNHGSSFKISLPVIKK